MERLVIEDEEIVVLIERVNSRELAPCSCGGVAEEKSDTGYVSASELGRPQGAKGSDTWSVWTECLSCGHVTERGHWPHLETWRAVIEDLYGNFITQAHNLNKETAIREAVSSYEDVADAGCLGDC